MVWNGGVNAEEEAGFLVGQVASLAGVTVKTVRHYEKLGLVVAAARQANGYKRYAPDTVVRVACIAALGRAGVPLSRAAQVLDHAPGAAGTVRTVADIIRAERDRLEDQLRTLEALEEAVAAGEGTLEELGRPLVDAIEATLAQHGAKVDRDTWRLERRVAGLLTSVGAAPDELPEPVLAYIRSNPADMTAALEADAAFARLRCASANDPMVTEVADQLRRAQPTVEALGRLLRPPSEDSLAAARAVMRPKLSAAQVAALHHAAGNR